jgi:segregation and condensation protein B
MSLKAKLEAVIYAAEEPVTLAQLAVLFADEALEWKARKEATESLPLPLEMEEPAYPESKQEPEPELELDSASAEQAAEVLPETNPEVEVGAVSETDPEAGSAEGPATEESSSEVLTAKAELEARRLARLRDREVRGILRPILDELIATYAAEGRGVEIREIAGGFRMATKPEFHDTVRLFIKSLKPALRLSLPALETLAVIAYKQPVTAPEVNEIRGVDSSAVFGTLLARKLISTAGRKAVIGRPILYKTTREFLLRFGLRDVSELPSMEEFEKLAAIELDEPETENSEQKPNPALGPEFDEAASEELEDQPNEDFESPEPSETAETAASNETTNPAEAAPAAPHPTEQAETENSPNGEKEEAPTA